MREVDFIKVNPTQNMTILVKTEHPIEEYAQIAAKMMAYEHVYGEQVGFIEKPVKPEAVAHLQMAGGEFCGNACISLAAYLAYEHKLNLDRDMELVIEASGTDQLVSCLVRRVENRYTCKVAMPIPQTIERKAVRYEGETLNLAIVRYESHLHIVMEVEHFNKKVRTKAESLAKLLGVTLGADSIGILLYKPHGNQLAPLIYVAAVDSMIWEKGCGSGTASLGAYLAWKHKKTIAVPVGQPGGTIEVAAEWANNRVSSLHIEGHAEIVAQGKAFI